MITRMRGTVLLLGIITLTAFAVADSKTEADLRHRLEVSEAARTKTAVELKSSLAKLAISNSESSSKATKATEDASLRASENAKGAQADSNLVVAVLAQAAATAQFQAAQLRSTTFGVIVVQLLVLIGLIAGFVHNAMMTKRNHRWQMEKTRASDDALQKQYAVIENLEKNTNSIKDALVVSTGKEAFARGVKAGEKKSQETQ
jgi:hypothetical protein